MINIIQNYSYYKFEKHLDIHFQKLHLATQNIFHDWTLTFI